MIVNAKIVNVKNVIVSLAQRVALVQNVNVKNVHVVN